MEGEYALRSRMNRNPSSSMNARSPVLNHPSLVIALSVASAKRKEREGVTKSGQS